MFKPKKSLGQNFLINEEILDKIVQAAEIGSGDVVVEIGPGTGNLTKKLAEKAGRVIAIEKDRRLVSHIIEHITKSYPNVEVVEADVLKFDVARYVLRDSGYKIIGNIPYYITSHLLKTIFEEWPRPELVVLTVQKEVAKRIVAKPPDMNLLALSVQFYSKPKIISYVSRGSFRPMPKVDSAIIRLTTNDRQPTTEEAQRFFKIVRAGFSGKRKQLINNLAKNFGMMKGDLSEVFEKTGLKHDIRAENLSLNQWIELSRRMGK